MKMTATIIHSTLRPWSVPENNSHEGQFAGPFSTRRRAASSGAADRMSADSDGNHLVYPTMVSRRSPASPVDANASKRPSLSIAETPSRHSHDAGHQKKSSTSIRSFSHDRPSSRPSTLSRPSVPIRSSSRHQRPSLGRHAWSSHSSLAHGIHYRNSKRSMTAPPTSLNHASQQPDSPLTFHYRSCELFRSLDADNNRSVSGSYSRPYSARHGSTTGYLRAASFSDQATEASSLALPHSGPLDVTCPDAVASEEHAAQAHPVPSTVIYWKSASSRRREYAKIDKSHRGLRGWWTRWAPRWCRGSTRQGFYNHEKDSEQGSVRRYRVDLPDEECLEDDDCLQEKQGMNHASPKLRRIWSCFGPVRKQEL